MAIMSQVLEHLPSPSAAFAQVMNHLQEGYLMLVQANFRGLVPRLLRRRWYAWLPTEHYWHFTPNGLTHLAKSCGFAKVECEYSSLVQMTMNARLMDATTKLLPNWKDQFHLLLKCDPSHWS